MNITPEIKHEHCSVPAVINDLIDRLETSDVKHDDIEAFCMWKDRSEETDPLNISSITKRSLLQCQLSNIVKVIQYPSLKDDKCESLSVEDAYLCLSKDDCSDNVRFCTNYKHVNIITPGVLLRVVLQFVFMTE